MLTTFFYAEHVKSNQVMRTIRYIIWWLLLLSLPIFFLSLSIGYAINSLWLYQYGFDKYNVGEKAELTDLELEEVARGLISYFNSNDESINLSFVKNGESFELFNEREILHLKDIKGLIHLDYYLLLITGTCSLAIILLGWLWEQGRYRYPLNQSLFGGGVLTLAGIAILALSIILNFDQLFLQFHLFSFTNDFWILDSRTDYLIRLFPQGFFNDAAIICVSITAGLSIALVIASGSYLYVRKKIANIEGSDD